MSQESTEKSRGLVSGFIPFIKKNIEFHVCVVVRISDLSDYTPQSDHLTEEQISLFSNVSVSVSQTYLRVCSKLRRRRKEVVHPFRPFTPLGIDFSPLISDSSAPSGGPNDSRRSFTISHTCKGQLVTGNLSSVKGDVGLLSVMKTVTYGPPSSTPFPLPENVPVTRNWSTRMGVHRTSAPLTGIPKGLVLLSGHGHFGMVPVYVDVTTLNFAPRQLKFDDVVSPKKRSKDRLGPHWYSK